jgi:nicotinate phosphoribosyltransferase
MDFAARQYNHNFRMDPIVRSLMDNDFYKFLMGQLISQKHPNVTVSFALTNRTKDVRLADIIDEAELREQLDHVRTLRFENNALIWLRGQTFYGIEGIFSPAFIEGLKSLQLPEYDLSVDPESGQFRLETSGNWFQTTWWEIHALEIVNELRYRSIMRQFSRSELDIMYARAKVKLDAKLRRLAQIEGLTVSDFGTRRRHSHLWQEHCILTAREILGDKFVGTSNAFFAQKHSIDAKGTNAHELPMVYAALAKDDEALRTAPYDVLADWQSAYGDNLRVALPDTYGSTQFLQNAPDWVLKWKGARPDSKDPFEAGLELIQWWKDRGEDPMQKLIIFADGLDVRTGLAEFDVDGLNAQPFAPMGADMVSIYETFQHQTNPSFGWGTTFTNDFIGCVPNQPDLMKPISLVCKVQSANGQPAVKMSDNLHKATGPADEIARYRRVFGAEGLANAAPLV